MFLRFGVFVSIHPFFLKISRFPYDKLKFIYIELPKFDKSLEELTSHQDKWLFLLRHLPDLEDRPQPFQDEVFLQLFEIAELANFSRIEQDSYQTSLKYYRDLNNVIDTSREEGRLEGLEEGQIKQEKRFLYRLLKHKFETVPDELTCNLDQLSLNTLERLSDKLFELETIAEITIWLLHEIGNQE